MRRSCSIYFTDLAYGSRIDLQNCCGWDHCLHPQSSALPVRQGRTGNDDNFNGVGCRFDDGSTKNFRLIFACKGTVSTLNTIFFKAVGCILIALILCVILSKQGKDFSVIISVVACCVVIGGALVLFEPVIAFIGRIRDLGNLEGSHIAVIMKAVGIGLVSQIASLICDDAGYSSLSKALQILTAAVILCLAVPLFQELLELIESVLGKV